MNRMLYTLAATLVAIVHFTFILFVIFGAFLLLKWPRLAWVHLPAAVWGVLIEFAGWYCPLTRVENALLQRAGRAGYSGGFVAHYIFSLIYPNGLTRGIEVLLGATVLVVNVSVYWRAFR
jgi:hypothetical protein